MALLLRDVFDVEFWEWDSGYSWRDGSGTKLFTVSNGLHHQISRSVHKQRGELYIGSAILSVDLFNGYMNLDGDTRYHLTMKGLAWNTDSEKSTPIVVHIPFAKLVKLEFTSESSSRTMETSMLLEIDGGIKVSADKNNVEKMKIEMIAVEDEEE